MASAYSTNPNSNQSSADVANTNRLDSRDNVGPNTAIQSPKWNDPGHSWDQPHSNHYTGVYSPGSIAASPMQTPRFQEDNKTFTLPSNSFPSAPAGAQLPHSGETTPDISIKSNFQSGTSPEPFKPLSLVAAPTQMPSSLQVTPLFQSGNPGQAPLSGSSAAPAVTSLPPTTTLTPNAGIANGIVQPQPTATMKITPLNGISNGMPVPNSAVNPPAPAGQLSATPPTDWAAKFKKETGTAFDPHSKMDVLNMNRLKGLAPVGKGEDTTLNHAQYRAGQYSR